jgi:hypothetical protein
MAGFKDLTAAIRAPFMKRHGLLRANDQLTADHAYDNNFTRKWRNAADTADVDVLRVDADDNIQLGGAYAKPPMRIPCIFRAVANGNIVTTRFHIFNYSGKITKITEIHSTAGNDAAAVTGHITKETSGQAPGDGTSVMSGTFNLKGTADTEQTATLSTALNNDGTSVLSFSAGDMLSFKLTGTATTAAGVLVMVWVQPDVRALDFSFYSAAVTSQDQVFAIANRSYPIRAIRFAHSAAETTDTTSNVQVTVDDGTEGAGAGTDLLTNDTNAGFDLNATANVPQVGAFTATTLVASDRLSVDFNSTNTEGAGVCVTVTVYPEADRLEIPFWLHDTNATDAWFFSADRDYQLWDGRQIHGVAAGGVSTLQIEKATGTTAASSGTAVLNTAFNLNATAATVQVADFVTVKATTLVESGWRLSMDHVNTEQSMVGLCFTVSLLAR